VKPEEQAELVLGEGRGTGQSFGVLTRIVPDTDAFYASYRLLLELAQVSI